VLILFCSIEILEPLGVIPRHQHDEAYELFIILSGCVDLYLNGTRKISGKLGDTLLVKPRNDHELINPDTGEKVYVQFLLSLPLSLPTFAPRSEKDQKIVDRRDQMTGKTKEDEN